MLKPFYAGIYATSPTVNKWNEAKEEEFVSEIKKNLPEISGLELPYWGGDTLHQHSDDFLFEHYPADWTYVLACVPGNMKNLSRSKQFGLASDNEEGRKSAVEYYKQANEKVKFLNEKIGRKVVEKVQIVTSPSIPVKEVSSSVDSLARSLEELVRLDWNGAGLAIEHCDSSRSDGSYVKGFMPLEDEINAISRFKNENLKVVINWGRSAIEGRGGDVVIEQLEKLIGLDLLAGLIFSGTCDKSEKFGSWQDNHAPARLENGNDHGEAGSILTLEWIRKSMSVLSYDKIEYLGMKVLAMPMDDASIEERIGINVSTMEKIRRVEKELFQ